jgi:hypothetical protein
MAITRRAAAGAAGVPSEGEHLHPGEQHVLDDESPGANQALMRGIA